MIHASDRATLLRRLQPWLVVFSSATFFFFEFMQVNMFNALDPYLFKAYHLDDATQLGHLAAMYMYANVIFLFPAGLLLDRYSTRRLVIIAMAGCVTATLLFSFTTALWQAELCRFVTGIGGAFCLLSSVRVASRWFLPTKMALVVGLIVTFAMLGAMLAQTPLTLLVMHFGWRQTLLFNAIFGYILLLLIIIFVQDCPPEDQSMVAMQHLALTESGLFKTVKQAFGNLQNWYAGIFASLTNLPVFILGSWGIMFLHQVQHLSRPAASVVTSAMFIGLMVGSPVFGWISDRLCNRRLPMLTGAIFSIVAILPVMYLPHLSQLTLVLLFFLIGFMSSAQIISYAVVAESNRAALTGASEGLASILIMSGGFLIPVFAWLLDLNWQHLFVAGVPHYTAVAFRTGMMLMPIGYVISILMVWFLKETHCRSFESREKHDASSE